MFGELIHIVVGHRAQDERLGDVLGLRSVGAKGSDAFSGKWGAASPLASCDRCGCGNLARYSEAEAAWKTHRPGAAKTGDQNGRRRFVRVHP
jgi:hypothetical protein